MRLNMRRVLPTISRIFVRLIATLLDRIEEQLLHEPATETRHKTIVVGLEPPWEHEKPIWQLRIGEFRVFYDVDANASRVAVRAIRHKPAHKTTEEIL